MKLRLDTWANAISGLGHSLRDKAMHTEFIQDQVLPDTTLESLYHVDDMAARLCDLIPDEMLRQGFAFHTKDTSLQEAIQNQLGELGVQTKFNEALVWARVFWGAALLIGADDGQHPSLPIHLSQIRSIRF